MSIENLDESFDIFNLSENLTINENFETAVDKTAEDQSRKRRTSDRGRHNLK